MCLGLTQRRAIDSHAILMYYIAHYSIVNLIDTQLYFYCNTNSLLLVYLFSRKWIWQYLQFFYKLGQKQNLRIITLDMIQKLDNVSDQYHQKLGTEKYKMI